MSAMICSHCDRKIDPTQSIEVGGDPFGLTQDGGDGQTHPYCRECIEKRLANEFSSVLRCWLTREEMREVQTRNASMTYTNCCASHDFCDANMAMWEAFRVVFGRESDVGGDSKESEADIAIWNCAWDRAKKQGFRKIAIR